MSTPAASPCTGFRWPWWRGALAGLAVLGLVLSGYLGWHFLADSTVAGCVAGGGCDEVLGSRWSAIGGVLPVSGLAAGVYLAALVAVLFTGPATEPQVRRLAWRALLVLAGAAAGSAVWFTVVQKWMVGAFCPWCMATHTTSLLLAAVVFWQAPKQLADRADAPAGKIAPPAAAPRASGRWAALALALAGVTLAGVMAVCQVYLAPTAVSRVGVSPEGRLPAVDPRAVPLLGPADAPHVVTLLFDHNCPHCQKLHALLDEAVARYRGRLAFALCPVPLNTRCNPFVERDTAAFQDSCELARLALAVWVASPEALPEFDRWWFTPESGRLWRPRGLAAAQAKAAELVAPAKLAAALADPWVARHMQTSVAIFGATGGNTVPVLVSGPHWTTPEPRDADELVSVLQADLRLPAP